MSNRVVPGSRSLLNRQASVKYKRWITRIVLAPVIMVIVFALAVAYRIHAGNKAFGAFVLPAVTAPTNKSSILIFSPHPDDETLGAGGLIQQTLKSRGKVNVVFVTNGDAFRVGVASYYKIFPVRPSDYIKYGEMRQKEALGALATLGLPPKNVTFLGYPDRGLMGMWEKSWLPSQPWTSLYSKASVNPYPNAPSYQKEYCGQNVLLDVERQIVDDEPTDIYVTHPTDDHPDHSASASYVLAAIKKLQSDGYFWADSIKLHYFLIHRGDWPVPQGNYPTLPFGPPAAFYGLDTKWRSLQLTAPEIRLKSTALNHYVSQEEMMGRFLISFVRKNEIYGELSQSSEEALNLPSSGPRLAALTKSMPPCALIAEDPIGDTDLRVFQPGGDIASIYAAEGPKDLYLKVTMHSRLSRALYYHLSLRTFDVHMNTEPTVVEFGFSPRKLAENREIITANGSKISWNGNTSDYVIPLSALGMANPKIVFTQATTMFSQVTIDHTGYRPIFLATPVPTVPLS
jgi:LmbE family N-acetylglucosaminyl deacetylase